MFDRLMHVAAHAFSYVRAGAILELAWDFAFLGLGLAQLALGWVLISGTVELPRFGGQI